MLQIYTVMWQRQLPVEKRTTIPERIMQYYAETGVVFGGAVELRCVCCLRRPVKMSDMEDDFMCDDEEDYDLVSVSLHNTFLFPYLLMFNQSCFLS